MRSSRRGMTKENFLNELKKINNNIQVIGIYKNLTTKVLCKCLIDNHEWYAVPYKLLNGAGCPMCAGKCWTTETFIKKMKEINNNILILSEYKGSKEKILCKCLIDGYEWNPTPYTLLKGHGCPKCAKNIKYTHEEFCNLINDKYNNNIKILSNYNGSKNKIFYRCNKCGMVHLTENAGSLLVKNCNYPCINCAAKERGLKSRLSQEEFEYKLHSKNNNIKCIDNYIKSNIKIKFYCKECKNYFYVEPAVLLHNDGRCPICSASKGEKRILNYLDNNKINFIKEYTFNDLLGDKNKQLRFDFAILNTLNEIICLIEFDGEFHFKKMYEDHDLEKQKRYDKMKDDYCKMNNIKLLRIPYWEFDNIEDILYLYLRNYINKAS